MCVCVKDYSGSIVFILKVFVTCLKMELFSSKNFRCLYFALRFLNFGF
jgi:hypothetical protein